MLCKNHIRSVGHGCPENPHPANTRERRAPSFHFKLIQHTSTHDGLPIPQARGSVDTVGWKCLAGKEVTEPRL